MPKLDVYINVKSQESNIEYKTTAIITEGKIKYKSEKNTIEIFDYNNNKLTRENDELRIDYNFDLGKNTTGIIFVKELNKNLKVNIETKTIERKNNDIKIEFIVENNTIIYQIKVIK